MLPSAHVSAFQNPLLVERRWLDQNHCLCICLEWAPWLRLSLENVHEVLSLYNRLDSTDVANRLPPSTGINKHSTHDILWISLSDTGSATVRPGSANAHLARYAWPANKLLRKSELFMHITSIHQSSPWFNSHASRTQLQTSSRFCSALILQGVVLSVFF